MRWRQESCPCCDTSSVGRRGLLALAVGGALASAAAAPALAIGTGPRIVRIRRMQTGETFAGTYWRDGRYDREALRRLDLLFRDPTLDEVTPMDPRLFDVLHTVAEAMGSDEHFDVISGYRAPETNAARAHRSRRVSRVSLHMSGMAADVRLPGRNSLELARIAANRQTGGVGLYRRDGFIHLDCGPARRW